jgi:filamentous hemagglutinin family protein
MFGFSTRWGWFIAIAISGAYSFSTSSSLAQIAPDGTLPNNSIININGNTFNITGGTQAGGNLFHSFKDFSVPTGSEAFFKNTVDIGNIITRVTGGSVSNIDGLIRTLGTANLFVINPSGIVFGPNASLNVGGSFVASTANAIQFGNQGFFSATNPEAPSPLLTIQPSALVSNQIAASIQNNSVAPAPVPLASSPRENAFGLRVPDGQSLLLVGGNIAMNGGGLNAFDGRVELAGLAAPAIVGLSLNDKNISLSVPQDVARADVSLTGAAKIDVTGGGQGSVAITARNIDILGGSQIRAGIGQGLTKDSSRPGDITLNATGLVRINHPSRVTNVVADGATGDAGDITIKAGEISIDNRTSVPTLETDPPPIGAALETSPQGLGRAGNVSLSTTGNITLIGQDVNPDDRVIRTSSSFGRPGGGDVTLKANGSISLSNAYLNAPRGNGGGNISLLGNDSVSIADNSWLNSGTTRGNSGNITIQSNGPVSIQRSLVGNNVSAGNAGDINITGQSVSITEGTRVEASSESGGVNSGNIRIFATDKVEISGTDPFHDTRGDRTISAKNTTLTTRAQEGATGNGGDITIKAGEIFIKNQASDPPNNGLTPALEVASDGLGSAGKVLLEATGNITLIGQDIRGEDRMIRTSNPNGRAGGGDITFKANGSISLSNAYLKAPTGNGEGHKISLFGNDSVSIVDNSFLNAGAERGNSGFITIQSNGPVSIQRSFLGNNVGLSEQAGNVGDINISGRSVSITDGTQVEASSESLGGKSGNIRIFATDQVEILGKNPSNNTNADRVDRNDYTYTRLTTTSQLGSRGQAGEISVNTPILRVTDGAILKADSENVFTGVISLLRPR